MPFTTVGWSESQDTAGVLTNVAALPDQHVTVSGDNIRVPALNQLVGYYALGTTITLAQLASPQLRRQALLDIDPMDVSAEPGSPPAFGHRMGSPITLETDEDLSALVAEAAAGAERESVFVWLADGPLASVSGNIFTVRATSATTLTAYTWTNCALTFSQTLPRGRYQVVGASCIATGGVAFRLVFPGYSWRPGGIACDAVSDLPAAGQRNGGWGVWGEFESTSPPTVDVLSVSADTAETVYLDLIKIA